MLNSETKRRIDSARDILVGKVPDPKSQVEQITIALIYKFMDDMDKESIELGGKAKFFSGNYKKYAWSNIFDPKLSGVELVALYGEAITQMNQNPHIPDLFKDIFKNAFLPYRDPETLKSFLKEINWFQYSHSEKLGDAFEYLLSILGSQGEAGQFRTPRHIIDFMVEIIDPKKNEIILDPACGTAGFLISAYRYILKNNSTNFDPQKDPRAFELHGVKLSEITINGKKYKGDKLTSDERARLSKNVIGYDISPDMVRLSLVNMYLHGFPNPRIHEYDTLTSEDKWNEYADIIMANPPFMSPKGGIKPHKRFAIESNRSEVLFVDYIVEHLRPQGRAAVIVPEGIIFQSQTAYKNLRKTLIEKDFLVGVISLPAGMFNPYSGVKTSILWIDRTLAKRTDKILFAKIKNDGFDLGAQRRPIEDNDLPSIFRVIQNYKKSLKSGTSFKVSKETNICIARKTKIAQDENFNLLGERYYSTAVLKSHKWLTVKLGELCVIERGASPRPIDKYITNASDSVNWVKIGDAKESEKYITRTSEKISMEGALKSRKVLVGDFVLSNSMSFGRPYIMKIEGYIHDGWLRLSADNSKVDKDFLYYVLGSEIIRRQFERLATGGVVRNLNSELVRKVEIPLPPIKIQKEVVAEIEEEQKKIAEHKQLIEQFEKNIQARIAKVWDEK